MSGSTGATRPKSVLWAVNQPQAPAGYCYEQDKATKPRTDRSKAISYRWELRKQ